jgi:hypothetical protein
MPPIPIYWWNANSTLNWSCHVLTSCLTRWAPTWQHATFLEISLLCVLNTFRFCLTRPDSLELEGSLASTNDLVCALAAVILVSLNRASSRRDQRRWYHLLWVIHPLWPCPGNRTTSALLPLSGESTSHSAGGESVLETNSIPSWWLGALGRL